MRASLLVLVVVQVLGVLAHPACLPGYTQLPLADITDANGLTCPEARANPLGMCCSPADEAKIAAANAATMPPNASPACQRMHNRLGCVKCDPWSYHLHPAQDVTVPLLCPAPCNAYATTCKLGPDYCKTHAVTDGSYCYPFSGEATGGALPRQGDGIQPFFTAFTGANPLKSNEMRGITKDPTEDAWFAWDGKGSIYHMPHNATATDADVKLILDMTARVEQNAELSFHYVALSPDYNITKCFYATYNKAGDVGPWNLQLSKFCINQLDGTVPELPLMEVERPPTALYHNGAWIGFDFEDIAAGAAATVPGVYKLYFTVGDSTTPEFVQDLTKPYGKILRMNVGPKGIEDNPIDNPFYSAATPTDMKGKVWVWGVRNPYRCSFNPAYPEYPDLWCGDVGEEAIERVVRVEKGNYYGWPMHEGTKCRTEWFSQEECDASAFTPPIFEYCHNLDDFTPDVCNNMADVIASYGQPGASVTGGAFYWGTEFAETAMNGSYIFGEFSKQAVMMLTWDGQAWNKTTLYDINDGMLHPVGFFPDPLTGDIYMVDVPFTTTPIEPQAGISKLGCGTACNTVGSIPEPVFVPSTMQPTQIPATPQGGRMLSELFHTEASS